MPYASKNQLTEKTHALVLAGGRGSRLHQLTDWRAKPAVPFAGKFNIIDFTLSNCINSGVRHISVLTQYKAQSLIRHIQHGWGFLSASLGEHVDVVPAQQQHGESWYSGTANAVYQNLRLLDLAQPDRVLILGGDHIYKMDYSIMLTEHARRRAEMSVACLEVPLAQASDFGVMSVDADQRIVAFDEKPAQPQALRERPTHALVSMGIYVFETELLINELERDAADPHSNHDFGKDIIPALLAQHRVYAHSFKKSCVNRGDATPYWRDVGTVDAYWDANMDLTREEPELNLYDDDWPILSLQDQLAPAKIVFEEVGRCGQAFNALLSSGCIVSAATVRRSVLFSKVRVGPGSLVEDSVVLPNVTIGKGVTLKRTIIDKHCCLPDGFCAGLDAEQDRARGFHVTERGITLVSPEMIGQRIHRDIAGPTHTLEQVIRSRTMIEKFAIKIMLLDDEPFMLKLLSRQLTDLGITALSAYTSGAQAIAALAEPGGAPDLILLDLNMPEMDGIEFVRRLVEQGFGGSLILISGEDERMLAAASTLVRAHKIALLGHLHKPVPKDALAALLGTWTPPRVQRPRPVKAIYSAEALRAAIDNGELVNYYQPKVALADGHVIGVESLVRWRHPVDGLVYPDQFIGVAEVNGLIDDLTRLVLRQALAQARAWRDAGLTLRVAVNLSMDNLEMLGFADFVAEQAALAGVATTDIVLEVTESRLMTDVRAPLDILTRLRLKRFRLSIDDFGTGNSSLVQLRDIPFDELKIDRSFVHQACLDETLRAIFNGSLHLAKQLGMEVVAEGVEDRADWDFLRLSDCHLAQGYFIARPMPAADLADWLVHWEERRAELLRLA